MPRTPGKECPSGSPQTILSSPSATDDGGMNLLFFLAMALVFNSHLERYYPRSWMAGDGLLGNCMFFALSGYRVTRSLSSNHPPFGRYLLRRLLRIYPASWLATLLIGPSAGWLSMASSIPGTLKLMVWPTRFTYVAAIVPSYIVLYWIRRWMPELKSSLILLALLVSSCLILGGIRQGAPRFLSEVPAPIYSLLFFACVLSGSILAISSCWRRAQVPILVGAVVLTLGYLGIKFHAAFTANWSGYIYILLLGGASSVSIVTCSLPFPAREFWLPRIPGLKASTDFVARYSLEIYVAHCIVIEWHWLQTLLFPFGIVAAVIISVVLAAAIGWASHRLQLPRKGPPPARILEP